MSELETAVLRILTLTFLSIFGYFVIKKIFIIPEYKKFLYFPLSVALGYMFFTALDFLIEMTEKLI